MDKKERFPLGHGGGARGRVARDVWWVGKGAGTGGQEGKVSSGGAARGGARCSGEWGKVQWWVKVQRWVGL